MPEQTLVTHPALSGPLSILLIAGIVFGAGHLQKWIWKKPPGNLELFCGAVILIGLLSVPVYVGSNLNMHVVWYARCIGWFMAGAGILGMVRYAANKDGLRNSLAQCPRHGKWALSGMDTFLISLVLLLLFLSALGPPTDADSLDYHIGGPIRILMGNVTFPSNDWILSRQILLGEGFNTIGLAIGTDNVNAILQFSALLWICYLIASLATADGNIKRVVALKLAVIPPILLFLIPNQKPQFAGAVAVVSAVIFVGTAKDKTARTYFLAVGALFYALSLKYSFYVTALIPWCFLAFDAYQNKLLKAFVLSNIFFYLTLLLPIHLINMHHYGSPISPLLADLFHEPGGHDFLRDFKKLLTNYSEGYGFPLSLLLPSSAGMITTCIGVGIFAFCFVDRKNAKAKRLLWIALGSFILTAFFCQTTSRFFAEPYYIAVAAFAIAPRDGKWFRPFNWAGSAQLMVMALSAAVGAYMIFPGALSWEQRDKVLSRTASGYNAAKYLDQHLPAEAVIFNTNLRTHAFGPRPSFAMDHLYMMKYFPAEFDRRLKQYSGKRFFYVSPEKIVPNYLIYPALKDTTPLFTPTEMRYEARNPFNHQTYPLFVYELDYDKLRQLDLANTFKGDLKYNNWTTPLKLVN